MSGKNKIVPLSLQAAAEISTNKNHSVLAANGIIYARRKGSTGSSGRPLFNKYAETFKNDSSSLSQTAVFKGPLWIIKYGPEAGALALTLSSFIPTLFACRATEKTALSQATIVNGISSYATDSTLNGIAFVGTIVAELFLAQRSIKKNLRLLLATCLHIKKLCLRSEGAKREEVLSNKIEATCIVGTLFLGTGLAVIASLPFLSQTEDLIEPYCKLFFQTKPKGLALIRLLKNPTNSLVAAARLFIQTHLALQIGQLDWA